MGMSFDSSGLHKKLDNMQKAISKLNGNVSFDVLFNDKFMSNYTNFSSCTEFLENSGFEINSPEDFASIPEEDLDIHVSKTTKFSSWDEMKSKAGEEYVSSQLKF